MNINFDSAEQITHHRIAESQTAAITDSHYGQSRHETQVKVDGEAQVAQEQSVRTAANIEIGRGRNLVAVV